MSETLYSYYDRELRFIRRLAEEFADQFPDAAGRLRLEKNRSTDPHVERLIESFALLAGRIHHKLDDEFPELTDALLTVLYPHYLAPIPSTSVVQFDATPDNPPPPTGFRIDRHARLRTNPVEYLPGKALPCDFRTGYPVTLWPITVTGARLQPPPFPAALAAPEGTKAALRIGLQAFGEGHFAKMPLEKLRFYLYGDRNLLADLYELLFNHTLQVAVRSTESGAAQAVVTLDPEACLGQVGFERDEGLLPYPNRSFLGYRLLTEFFAFPAKFHFLDLGGWDRVRSTPGFGKQVEVVFFLGRTSQPLEQGVEADTFRLGCTPVVNLFPQSCDPIALTQRRYEYTVLPDRTHVLGLEVYSVDSVTSTDPAAGTVTEYQPFYSFRHGMVRESNRAFWIASRRPSGRVDDPATEVNLNLVDLAFNPRLPADSVLNVHATCLNRNLPSRLQKAGEKLAFELLQMAPARPRCLHSATQTLRPPLRRGAHWRLVSHLNLNHLSLTDAEEGRAALQEILALYDFSDPGAEQHLSAVTRNLIEGILEVSSRRVVGRVGSPTASGFARGVEVTVKFDEPKYAGTGVYLFACVLERFLGLYVTINSFSQLVGRTKQSEGIFKRWRPRAGEIQLL
jgi:type VI secretion system protein ImpG